MIFQKNVINRKKKPRTGVSRKTKDNKHKDNWTIVILDKKKHDKIIQGLEVDIVKSDENKHVNKIKNMTSNNTKSRKPSLLHPKNESSHQGLKRLNPQLKFKISSTKDTDNMIEGRKDHSKIL